MQPRRAEFLLLCVGLIGWNTGGADALSAVASIKAHTLSTDIDRYIIQYSSAAVIYSTFTASVHFPCVCVRGSCAGCLLPVLDGCMCAANHAAELVQKIHEV